MGAEQEEAVLDGHPSQRENVSQGDLGVLNLETNIETINPVNFWNKLVSNVPK